MRRKIVAFVLSFLLTLGILSIGRMLLLDYAEPGEIDFQQKEIILENVTLEEITP